MITDNDNDILEKLDPDSLLDEEKLKLLGWCSGFNIPGLRNRYHYKDKGVALVESYKKDMFDNEIFNGYSFHMGGWVSHCWTVAELIELMKRCKLL